MKRKLRIYNTLSREVEEFRPLNDKEVGIYVCGLTPYDYAHIGHARTYVFFDVFIRFLRYLGYKVKHVQNFTDVDDKIIDRALKEGKKFREIAEKYERAFLEDMERLHVIKPDVMPRVSDHIEEISNLIEKLKEKGYAYEIDDGIYYHVPLFKEYGKLSHQNLEELNKHRIEPNPNKKDIKDFSLWKFAKEEDYKTSSVFRPKCCKEGRPGWHIECSAMSMKYLGNTLDIHGGGKDLIFPHHENEIAQSEAATGKVFSKYWMHVHFVNIKGEKMSKSLKNFIRIRDALSKFKASTLRIFLLSTHYRKDLDYNDESLSMAKKIDLDMRKSLGVMVYELNAKNPYLHKEDKHDEVIKGKIMAYKEEFIESLLNDVHTERAIGIMKSFLDLFIEVYQGYAKNDQEIPLQVIHHFYDEFAVMNNILGIYDEKMFRVNYPEDTLRLVKEREAYRNEREYEKADQVREKLIKMGYIVEDFYNKTIIYPSTILDV